MNTFSSKELYMMNGGNKLYIYKDGFGDVYNATPSEETEWANEYITTTLLKIETETNLTTLKFAIESLRFHHYPAVNDLLIRKLEGSTSPQRKIAFAYALWTNIKYNDSFKIILDQLTHYRTECLTQVTMALMDFHNNEEAKEYLYFCLLGDDVELFEKSKNIILSWAWTGIPKLRENDLLDKLTLENKNTASFKQAIVQLENILNIKNQYNND
jgi:hypothetical protein